MVVVCGAIDCATEPTEDLQNDEQGRNQMTCCQLIQASRFFGVHFGIKLAYFKE